MNKRQGKKRYKKALEIMRTSRKTGIGVTIINHVFVDKNGKQCVAMDAMKKGSRMIMLKRPKIQYYKTKN